MTDVTIGGQTGDHVRISVAGYEHPRQVDFDDGNWILSSIEIDVRGFSAHISASLRGEEFERFLVQLQQLNERLTGSARFETVDRLGNISATGFARDAPGGPNRLEFALAGYDQSYLNALIGDLTALLAAFPVRENAAGGT
jgi:hypothetical protein